MITSWQVTDGTPIGQQLSDGKVAPILAMPHLLFNAAGTLLISTHNLSLTFWTLSQGGAGQKYMRTLIASDTLWNATLSPDGRYLAATGSEVEVRYATLVGWRTAACAIANRTLSPSELAAIHPEYPL